MIQGLMDRRANIISLQNIQTGSGALLGSYSMDSRGSFMERKVTRLAADHSPASGAEVIKNGAVMLLLLCFMEWTGVPYLYLYYSYIQIGSLLKLPLSMQYVNGRFSPYLNAVECLFSMAGEKVMQIYLFCGYNGDL
jgi:hypothetical protein